MRILVFSDSHGNKSAMERAVREQPDAEVILFLGDGAEEAEAVRAGLPPQKRMLTVRGNNDWRSSAPDFDELTVGNTKIFFTHGHLFRVKYDLYTAVCAAKSRKANILLFGHTHTPMIDYDDGLYLMNPGALCASWGSLPGYGTVDITPAGILLNRVELK
ncbi:MAG: metallophosphoesterase [Firmicutes bacterium]|nr:metallophosphoesterase [Bacillota bacterium]